MRFFTYLNFFVPNFSPLNFFRLINFIKFNQGVCKSIIKTSCQPLYLPFPNHSIPSSYLLVFLIKIRLPARWWHRSMLNRAVYTCRLTVAWNSFEFVVVWIWMSVWGVDFALRMDRDEDKCPWPKKIQF